MENTLTDNKISRLIEEALLEDIGLGDITTDAIVEAAAAGHGDIRVKEAGVIAGLEIAALVFSLVDPRLIYKPACTDGFSVEAGKIVAVVDGPFSGILKAERTCLNILQRMSGIATLTQKFVDAVRGTGAKITDTRKTAPGLRILDKLAVRMGGGVNHRFALDDMVLIKDNHIAAAGGIEPAVKKCHNYLGRKNYKVKIEVETRSLEEVREAVRVGGIDRIMLDNFPPEEMKKAVRVINHTVEVEASGNVSLENVRGIAETGVDFISVGALTHSVRALDISLKIAQSRQNPHTAS